MKSFLIAGAAILASIIWFFDSKAIERRRTQLRYSKEFEKYVRAQTSLMDEELQEMINDQNNKDLRSSLSTDFGKSSKNVWSYVDKDSLGEANRRAYMQKRAKKQRPFWPDWDVY